MRFSVGSFDSCARECRSPEGEPQPHGHRRAINVGGQNTVSVKDSVIPKNGNEGVQANGATANVFIATTLLDQNGGGAVSVVNGSNVLTYGNNDIVGSIGSGFTGTAPLH